MKLTKPKLDNEQLIEQIVMKLKPLLVIKAELPTRDEDDDVVENGNFNNQQYLFETIGLIISLVPHEYTPVKVKLVESVFSQFSAIWKNASQSKIKNQSLFCKPTTC